MNTGEQRNRKREKGRWIEAVLEEGSVSFGRTSDTDICNSFLQLHGLYWIILSESGKAEVVKVLAKQ